MYFTRQLKRSREHPARKRQHLQQKAARKRQEMNRPLKIPQPGVPQGDFQVLEFKSDKNMAFNLQNNSKPDGCDLQLTIFFFKIYPGI